MPELRPLTDLDVERLTREAWERNTEAVIRIEGCARLLVQLANDLRLGRGNAASYLPHATTMLTEAYDRWATLVYGPITHAPAFPVDPPEAPDGP